MSVWNIREGAGAILAVQKYVPDTVRSLLPSKIPLAALGAVAVGALALAAFAVGALAVGSMAIGSLSAGRVRFRSLEVGELKVGTSGTRDTQGQDLMP